jgi:hypothetical protein
VSEVLWSPSTEMQLNEFFTTRCRQAPGTRHHKKRHRVPEPEWGGMVSKKGTTPHKGRRCRENAQKEGSAHLEHGVERGLGDVEVGKDVGEHGGHVGLDHAGALGDRHDRPLLKNAGGGEDGDAGCE